EVRRVQLDHALETVGLRYPGGDQGGVHGIEQAGLEFRALGLADGGGHQRHDGAPCAGCRGSIRPPGAHVRRAPYFRCGTAGRRYRPPVAASPAPVTEDACADSRQAPAAATASGWPGRCIGMRAATRAARPGSPARAWMVVSMVPGATALTWMRCGASSRARPTVSASRAALEAA